MTVVDIGPPPARAATPPRVPRRRGRWRARWYRLVVPFGLLALLVGVTLVARHLEEPRLGAADTLAPAGTGADGSSELARMLQQRGVRVQYVSTMDEAVEAGSTGEDAVVFIPRPTLFGAYFAELVPYLPGEHRVVMVAPSDRQLSVAGTRVRGGDSRWATTAAEPGCTVPEAVAAGRAAVLRDRYEGPDPRSVCYDGGLVRDRLGDSWSQAELFVVGSADPFRNRRIHEHHNATLAMELLATHDRVIWAGALPLDFDFQLPELPDLERPEVPELDPPSRREQRSTTTGLDGMFFGYPASVLAGLALAALVAVLIGLARGRRLGGPVSEPLPVVVPAVEVVAGRGRLYQRAQGRAVALAALRAAALRRILPAVGLPAAPPPTPEQVVAAVATRTGQPPEHIWNTLYGPEPATDAQLGEAVAALDALVESVIQQGGVP